MSSVLIVTGGGRGIGAAVCRRAARDGWDVCVNYASDVKAAQKVVDEVGHAGRRAIAVKGDMAREADIGALFDEAEAMLGPVTGLHAQSGVPDRVAQLAPSVPIGRAADPAEIAEAVVWMLSDAASYCVGANLRVGGGR